MSFLVRAEKEGSALQGISALKPNAATWSQLVGATFCPLTNEKAS